ncbi:MAG: hypothetical protein AAF660_00955 [Pseudomonadota bacterium]
MHPIRLIFATHALLLAACGAEPDTGDAASSALPLPAVEPVDAATVDGCQLTGSLYGAIEGAIDWASAQLSCEGMPRPAGAGARLRFAGPHPDGEGTLAVIVALPGHTRERLAESMDGRVTIIEEGNGRFFAANEEGSCWIDILDIAALDEHRELTSGRLYCIRPLAEINGSSSLTLPELEFSGLIDWSAS